ncbi:MAG TPA: ankyrin repeat domain-containing protein [Gammaproteobacteria bacterium]|nr:ankyrin repeat domain-containing protein [Gammaproteobacteria bacterium]
MQPQPFLFSKVKIAQRLKSNEADLAQAENSQDTIMQAELYKHRGLLYLEAIKIDYSHEKNRLASKFFSEAIVLNADARITAFCLSKRASLHLAQAKVGACIADFVAACKLVKNDVQIWFEYGKVLVDLERFEEALGPLKQALILRPQDGRMHDLIATVINSDRVSENCLDDIKALMKVGRTLNAGSQKGSDLHLWLQIVQAGDSNFMSYLAPQVDTQMRDGMGNTALHYAARSGQAQLIASLVKEYLIDPNAENRNGLTPLMVALRSGKVVVIKALTDVGAKYPGAQWSLAAFENFPFFETNVSPTKETRGLKRAASLETEEAEETTEFKRTTSFRVF